MPRANRKPLRRAPAMVLAVAALALASCKESPHCSASADKDAVMAIVGGWYLYPELLPASIDPAFRAQATARELLDKLTEGARAAGKDRYWSYVTTLEQVRQHYGAGQSAGYGIGLLTRGSQLFLGQVYRGSAAADAGFVRGDQILQIGTSPQTLVPVATLIAAGTVTDALASGQAGVTRVFEVQPPGGAVVQRTVTTRIFDLDPVPAWHIDGTTGYLDLRTFIRPAEAPMQGAFAAFRSAGITDLIVDLRYNGGGLLSTATLLADLIGGGLGGGLMYEEWFNPSLSYRNRAVPFTARAQSAAPSRVAFLTTGLSASASELVINVLDPWLSVALVGETTYGKPVGQNGFQVDGCDTVVYVVAEQLANGTGHGGYYQGLPDGSPAFRAPLCAAADDLTREKDDPLEASHAAALAWLRDGTCPPAPAAPGVPALRSRAIAPAARHPSPSQVDMPGLF